MTRGVVPSAETKAALIVELRALLVDTDVEDLLIQGGEDGLTVRAANKSSCLRAVQHAGSDRLASIIKVAAGIACTVMHGRAQEGPWGLWVCEL